MVIIAKVSLKSSSPVADDATRGRISHLIDPFPSSEEDIKQRARLRAGLPFGMAKKDVR